MINLNEWANKLCITGKFTLSITAWRYVMLHWENLRDARSGEFAKRLTGYGKPKMVDTDIKITRKLSYRKDYRAMHSIYGCPEYFLKFSSMSAEVLKNFRQSLDTPTLLFLPNFLWVFVRIDPENVPSKLEVRSFTRSWPEIIMILVIGVGVANPNFREAEDVGVGDGTVQKSVCEFL